MKENKGTGKLKQSLDQIPFDSSLGLLAIGDIAFEAWREVKKKHNKETIKKTEKDG